GITSQSRVFLTYLIEYGVVLARVSTAWEPPMSIQDAVTDVLRMLPVERQKEVLDFAQFLSLKQEQQEWQQSGLDHFAGCYGPDEPDYGEVPTHPGQQP